MPTRHRHADQGRPSIRHLAFIDRKITIYEDKLNG
jgi:hypothetical protein